MVDYATEIPRINAQYNAILKTLPPRESSAIQRDFEINYDEDEGDQYEYYFRRHYLSKAAMTLDLVLKDLKQKRLAKLVAKDTGTKTAAAAGRRKRRRKTRKLRR
jgi:hypothetical protein